MKRSALMLGVTLIIGIAIGLIGSHVLNAQPAPFTRADVLKADLAGMEGQEVMVQRVELAPRGASGKHWHPGHEVAYVLEGSLIYEQEGSPPRTVNAGDALYGPAKIVHEGKNASATAPVKVLAFRIHPKGQPVAHVVTEAYFQK